MTLEHNNNVLNETIEQQYLNFKELLFKEVGQVGQDIYVISTKYIKRKPPEEYVEKYTIDRLIIGESGIIFIEAANENNEWILIDTKNDEYFLEEEKAYIKLKTNKERG